MKFDTANGLSTRLLKVDINLKRASELQQALRDFVFDADGELAIELERFSGDYLAKLSNYPYRSVSPSDLAVDLFLVEGRIGEQTPIQLFLAHHTDLSEPERTLVNHWHRGFLGLFEVKNLLTDGFELMNWLTTKSYQVLFKDLAEQTHLKRVRVGEILLAELMPLDPTSWIFANPKILLGKLGKPKLAVAIGHFKQYHYPHLYGDAPELLQEAWESVEHYHHQFVQFFGSDEITLPGHQLEKKLTEFQQATFDQRIQAAGIEREQLLQTLADDAVLTPDVVGEVAESLQMPQKDVEKLWSDQKRPKMVMPHVRLPDQLSRVEQVTALSEPRWGQVFLATYKPLQAVLESQEWNLIETEKLVRKALADPNCNAYVWHRLATQYPVQLNDLLSKTLERPDFALDQDLDHLLQDYKKQLQPELPETASVPIHLHGLFQEVFVEMNTSQTKTKGKQKLGKGFQA
jgi:hypothetical protein